MNERCMDNHREPHGVGQIDLAAQDAPHQTETGEAGEVIRAQTALLVPCEVYSRIVGYLRPIQNWNAGKRQEFADRKAFNANDLPAPRPLLATPFEVAQ